jgi:DNA invertase Pin-like site-specific DNA recombinase
MARAKRFTQNNNTNAICYYRYSSDAQRDCSIEQQKEEAHKYCKKNGLHIIGEYADRAISGTRIDRPALQQMLNEAKRLRPAYLILWKTDRLSRDRLDSAIVKGKLREYGVQIECVAESMPKDEADRVLIESITEGLAAHFILQHSKNVTRGLSYNAENALYNGRKILGYRGQANQRYEIDSETAPIVQRMFNDYAGGKPMKVIADELNAAGYTTVRGKSFTEKSLWHTLHNRSYIGEYKWGDIVVEDGFPQLVSVELFERVQDMMEKNKHGGRGGAKKLQANPLEGVDFWLTGKLFCGECGAPLSGISGTSSHNGKNYYYYACNNHKKHMCNVKNIRKNDIERVVAHILEECINDATLRLIIADRVYDYYMREFAGDDSYEKSLVASIKDVDAKLSNILRAIEMGIFNETTQARMSELEERKRQLNDELTAERNRQKYSLKPEHVVRYLECFVGSLNVPSLRDKVLAYLVEKIYIYNDKVVINFYYSEDNREIDLKEFNEYLNNLDSIMDMMDGASSFDHAQKKLDAMWESIIAKDEDETSF